MIAPNEHGRDFERYSSTRVLVADDQCLIRNALVGLLANFGFSDVVTAANGAELVLQARRESPDVIISDVNMPELNGPSALDQVPDIPCVLVSGEPFPAKWCEANAHRLRGCLQKPFRLDEFESICRTLV